MPTLAMSVLLLAVTADHPVEYIAHRGESADAPENTLAAFRLAWERGVRAIELDVHLTKDGRLAVCHDKDTKRTTGVFRTIATSTYAELSELDAGRWKGAKFQGERIPLLEDALATIPNGARCFIEIKVGPEAVPALVKAVEDGGKRRAQLVVISFNAATVAEAKRRLPDVKVYLLSKFKRTLNGSWTPSAEKLISQAREINADGLSLAVEGPLDEPFARRVREAKLELYVWTVDREDDARRLLKLGIDGITTNRAAALSDAVAK